MTQQVLAFDGNEPQQEQLERVATKIAHHVLAFCRARMESAQLEFRMEELQEYVRARVGIAPDSAGRILRHLRQQQLVEYHVINRRASIYCLCDSSRFWVAR